MPTGGAAPTEENIRAWFEAGVACVGMGSKLITKQAVAAEDYASITEKVAETLAWIKNVRGNQAPTVSSQYFGAMPF